MTILPKAIYRFGDSVQFLSNYQGHLIEHKSFKFVWKHNRPQITKAILRKKKWSWKNQAPQIQTILQSFSNQDSMVLV